NLQRWNAPFVFDFLVEFNEVVRVGEAFSKPIEVEHPRAGTAEHVLEFGAKSGEIAAALPALAVSAALKSVAAHEIRVLGFHVAEAGNINAVGAASHGDFVFVSRDTSTGTAPHGVIHKVVSQLAAGVRQAVGKLRRAGVQQDARRLQGRGVKENNAAVEFKSCFRLPVNHSHARDSLLGGIVNQAVHHAVRAKREFASGLRSGKRGIQAAEVRLGNATVIARTAVVAGGAS